MNDVTIQAPKTAPVALTQIVSWLGVANALKDILVAQKVEIPGALADLIGKLGGIASAFAGGVVAPNSIENDLADVLVLAKAVQNATGHGVLNAGINDLIAAVQWTQAGIVNVEAGQFGVVASGKISVAGELVPVCAAVFRTDKGAAAIAAGFVEPPASQETVQAADYDALQAKLDTATANAQQLEKAVEAGNAEIADMSTKLAGANSEVVALQKQVADLQNQLAAAKAAPAEPPAPGTTPPNG